MSTTAKTPSLPSVFIWRRLHSLFGLWIVIFLIEHIVTNSQAALLIGKNGEGFIRAVNFIKNLPYLPVIEITLLGVPILFHMIWGIKYLFTSRINSFSRGKAEPVLKKYPRNHAYSMQRITSWILLVGIIAHVGYMRFYMYPVEVNMGDDSAYFVRLHMDPGLYTVSDRLGVKLFDAEEINMAKGTIGREISEHQYLIEEAERIEQQDRSSYKENTASMLKHYQAIEEKEAWLKGLEKRRLSEGEVIADAPDFGTATLLIVRDSFKSVFKSILYTIFVLAAAFHGFNGLWTFMITWGVVLKMRSQSRAVNCCVAIMLLIAFLGLAAVWGTYWVNLRN